MKYELKKLFAGSTARVLLVLGFLALTVLAWRTDRTDSGSRRAIRQAEARYAGMSCQEALPQLEREMQAADESAYNILGTLRLSVLSYAQRDEEMRGHITEWRAALQTEASAYQRRNLQKTIAAYNRAYAYPVCDRNAVWRGLLSMEDSNYGYLYLLLVLALCCTLFSQEHSTGMYQLLYAAKHGKARIYKQKICAGILTAALLGMLFQTILFVMLWIKRGLSFSLLTAPVQSFPPLADCPFALNLAEYVLLRGCGFALCGVLTIALIAAVSAVCSRALVIFGICAALLSLLLLPDPTSAAGDVLHRAGLLSLLRVQDYLGQFETVNVCGFPVWQITLSVLFTASVTAGLLLLGKALFAEGCSC